MRQPTGGRDGYGPSRRLDLVPASQSRRTRVSQCLTPWSRSETNSERERTDEPNSRRFVSGTEACCPPNTEELAGELVAFANAEGGVVFLGVDDSGAARGIPPERWDAVEHWLLNVATHNCDPPTRPIVRKALLPDDEESDDRIFAGGGAARTVRAPNIGWSLLHAGRVHKTGPHAAGACPAIPAAGPRVRVRRAARACRRRGGTSTAIDSRRSSDDRRRFPGSTFCATLD